MIVTKLVPKFADSLYKRIFLNARVDFTFRPSLDNMELFRKKAILVVVRFIFLFRFYHGLCASLNESRDLEKRLSPNVGILIKLYDKAIPGGRETIPHPSCHLPFKIIDVSKYWQGIRSYYCASGYGKYHFCSKAAEWRPYDEQLSCYKRGPAAKVAAAQYWRIHPECVPIFLYPNTGEYYKGCVNSPSGKTYDPWCSLDMVYKGGRYLRCQYLGPRWLEWSSWDECTKSCGTGSKTRKRVCRADGAETNQCKGPKTENHECNTQLCPVNGAWGEWTKTSECSVTCGGAIKFKFRECNNPAPQHGGSACSGNSYEEIKCGMDPCPEWRPWTEWGQCSTTCGSGVTTRSRECKAGDVPSTLCYGDKKVEDKLCIEKECSIDGGWGEWTHFGECTKTCGGGIRKRTRKCNNPEPKYGGKSCAGDDSESEACNDMLCPIDGGWGEWTDETSCSNTCGNGTQIRTRKCDNPPPQYDGQNCPSNDGFKIENCNLGDCPEAPQWGVWSKYGECSVTCGTGYRSRTRSCFQMNSTIKVSDEQCPGNKEGFEECSLSGCLSAAKSKSKLSGGAIAGIVLGSLAVLGACVAFAVFMKREKSGNPEFFTLFE